MDGYSTIFGVKWPKPGTAEIIAVIALVLFAIVVYMAYKYYQIKEQNRIHNYQLFLFRAKRKGLNNFQFKILKNMASYLKLSDPKVLVTNSVLFESILSDFVEYLKKQTEGEENIAAIFRDLAIIYERLYFTGLPKKIFESMDEIENGEIVSFTTEQGEVYLAKVAGRGAGFIALNLITSGGDLKSFENETAIEMRLLRLNDAEYLIKTVTAGIDLNSLRVRMSDEITREREFRHPYINAVIPATVTIASLTGESEPEKLECTILQLNENECVVRISSRLDYGREYPVAFEIDKYKFNINSRIVSSKTVDTESVYYLTFRFLDMTEPGKVILTKYISESV